MSRVPGTEYVPREHPHSISMSLALRWDLGYKGDWVRVSALEELKVRCEER